MFYVHKDGFIYNGDLIEEAREATPEEFSLHLGELQVITPPVDQSMADMWEALLAMPAQNYSLCLFS